MTDSNQCNVSSDCFKVIPDGIARTCFTDPVTYSNLVNFCDCPIKYGWKGAQCDEVSSYLNLSRFIVAMYIMVAFVLVLVLLRMFHQAFANKISVIKQPKIVYTGILSFFCILTALIRNCFILYAFFEPSALTVVHFNMPESEQIDIAAGSQSIRILELSATIFFMLAMFHLVLTWHDFLQETSKHLDGFLSSKATVVKNILRWLSGSYVFVVIFTLVFNTLLLSQILIMVSLLVFIAFYLNFTIGFRKTLHKALSVGLSDGNESHDRLHLLTKCIFWVGVLGLTSPLIRVFGLLLEPSAARSVQPGEYDYSVLVGHIAGVGLLALQCFLTWFICKVFYGARRVISRTKGKRSAKVGSSVGS